MSATAEALSAENEFLGLTAQDCAVDCTEHACVITGKAYCSHPMKAGLQSRDKADGSMVRRYNAARKFLAIAEAKRAKYDGVM